MVTSRFSSHERSGLQNGPRPHQCAAQHLWSGAGTRSAGTAPGRQAAAPQKPPYRVTRSPDVPRSLVGAGLGRLAGQGGA